MFNTMKSTIKKDIRHLKHKYLILKIKWIFLFVLPIVTVVLAYQVSKQFLKIKVKELAGKELSGQNKDIKQDGTNHDTVI